MRYLLIFWALPIGFLAAWYGLSYHDINFGTVFFSRALHDAVFQVYGDMIGVAPETIPWLVLDAIIFDPFLIMGLFAFRRRKQIRAWWVSRRQRQADENAMPDLPAPANAARAPEGFYTPAE